MGFPYLSFFLGVLDKPESELEIERCKLLLLGRLFEFI